MHINGIILFFILSYILSASYQTKFTLHDPTLPIYHHIPTVQSQEHTRKTTWPWKLASTNTQYIYADIASARVILHDSNTVKYSMIKATNRNLCFAHTFVQYNYHRFGNVHVKSSSRKKKLCFHGLNDLQIIVTPIYGSVHVSQWICNVKQCSYSFIRNE